MDKFDPPIPVLIQHLDNLLEPHVVRNLLNSLHSKQHLVNANHRLPATEIESCSVMTHVKPLVETAFIRSIFQIDIIYVCMLFQIVAHAKSVVITCQNTIFPSYPNQTKAFANLLTTDLSTPSPYTFSIYFQPINLFIVISYYIKGCMHYRDIKTIFILTESASYIK